MSNLVAHAERELKLAGLFDKDSDYNGALGPAILRVVQAFADERPSGGVASVALTALDKLLRFEPLTPLTGEDHEWTDVSIFHPGPRWQNNRCFRVFKGADGRAYDIEGRLFREPNGNCYLGEDSRVYIEFPYTPKREYVDVAGSGKDEG